MTPHHTTDTPWPRLADCATVDPRGLDLVIAAYLRMALADYLRCPPFSKDYRSAVATLREVGLLTDDGLDTHGYTLKLAHRRSPPQGRPRKPAEVK